MTKSVKQLYIPTIRTKIGKNKKAIFIIKQNKNGSWMVFEYFSNILNKK